ncbi:MAG: leucine-rich repeat domain-containing protein [Paludibacteraceae bacterium]|nr:leucine-rich repeat domain-containing protein [Paludibacteraceae bacterium]
MKKHLFLLVMIFVFSSIPNCAQTVVSIKGLRFLIENGHAIVGRQDKELSGDIIIPSSIEYEGQSYPVTGIVGPIDTHSYSGLSSISADGAAFQGTAITSVTLPATITSINTCSFINCSYLKKVVLPETITSIGWGAFAYCSSLTEINMPNSLQSLSAWCFGGCI